MTLKVAHTDDSENELIQLIATGDQIAFKKLYTRYKKKIYSLALSILQNPEDSEDILVEVFTSLWENRITLPDIDNISSFIYTITKNKSLNLFKKRFLRNQKEQLSGEYSVSQEIVEASEAALHFKETESILKSIADRLPNQQKLVFDLIKIQGYNRKEVAEMLNLSENTVRNHLNVAVKAVKKDFESNYPHLLTILLWLFFS